MQESRKKSKKDKNLQSINSVFDAMKDYFIFLVTLSSSFEILATILEGLSQGEIIGNFELTLFSNLGLAILFISGLVPSIIGLFYISLGRRFIALENAKKANFTYLFVKKMAITASIGFLTGFSFIVIPDFIQPLFSRIQRLGSPIFLLLSLLSILALATFVIPAIRRLVAMDNSPVQDALKNKE